MSESRSLTRRFCEQTGICFYEGPTTGPTLILLHGVARNHTDWLPLLPSLQDDWHLVLVDHLGHGSSFHAAHRSTDTYTVAHYAATLSQWLKHRTYSRVMVVGHSLGAMVSLALAANLPDRMAGLVLEDPPFDSMGCKIADGPYKMQFEGMQRVAEMHNVSIEQRTIALGRVMIPLSTGLVPMSSLRDHDTLTYSAECLSSVDPLVFTPLVEGRWLEGFDASSVWRSCRVPVVGMQADPATGGTWSDEDVQTAQSLCPALRVVRFDQTGHQIHRTNPHKFLDTVTRFRDECSL